MKNKKIRSKVKTGSVDNYSKFRTRWRQVSLIDERIRSGRVVNCTILARELEVSRRTVLRDIEFLKYDLGAPVEFDTARNTYYYNEPNWNLPTLRLTEGELFSMMIAEKVLAAYAGTPWFLRLEQIFNRIIGALPDRVEIEPKTFLDRVAFSTDAPSLFNPDHFDLLAEAIRKNRTIRMEYTPLDVDDPKKYLLEPYCLRYARGAWYLAARNQATGKIPVFNLSRIQTIELTEDTFDYDDSGFDPETYFLGTFSVLESSMRHRIEIHFRNEAAKLIKERRWHRSQSITELPNGEISLKMEISSLYDVLPWVLSWGSNAKVIEPKEFAEIVQQEGGNIFKRYFLNRD